MTRTTNARIAGFAFLFYIAVGITGMIVVPGASGGEDMAVRLAGMERHAAAVHIGMVLGLVTAFTALTLGVALYGITRQEDHELALLALTCRVVEGALIVVPTLATLGLLSLAAAEGTAPGAGDGYALAEFLVKVQDWNVMVAATFFAVGSTLFTWLLLRGRAIPVSLAWIGLFASVLLVVGLPMRLVGVLDGATAAWLLWIPMGIFEIVLGLWLLIKGVAPASPAVSAPA